MLGAANEERGWCLLWPPVSTELGGVMGPWEGRESQGPPPSAPLDVTTPLGLSRQHLSYLQEIGSGWFGKVSGLGGGGRQGVHTVRGCTPVLCPSPLLLPLLICSPPAPLAPSAHPSPSPLSTSHPLPPPHPPTSVRQRLPPHSIDHSAWPPGSPRVRLSILPSARPCIHRTLGL